MGPAFSTACGPWPARCGTRARRWCGAAARRWTRSAGATRPTRPITGAWSCRPSTGRGRANGAATAWRPTSHVCSNPSWLHHDRAADRARDPGHRVGGAVQGAGHEPADLSRPDPADRSAAEHPCRGDSVLVFYEGDPGTRNDDSWLRGEVKDVQAGVCVDANGNHPAWVLTLGAQWIAGSQFNVAGAITTGSPVRGFTSTTYSLWLSPTDNQYYLAQTVNSSTQPMVGPLSGPNGLTFNYYDANGVVTADSSKVAQIEIRVRGRTQSPISQPGAAGVAYKID